MEQERPSFCEPDRRFSNTLTGKVADLVAIGLARYPRDMFDSDFKPLCSRIIWSC